MTKKNLKDIKPEDIVKMEPAKGSSQNASAWEPPMVVEIRNKPETHYIYQNNVVTGRWLIRVKDENGVEVRSFIVEGVVNIIDHLYANVGGLADWGEFIGDLKK